MDRRQQKRATLKVYRILEELEVNEFILVVNWKGKQFVNISEINDKSLLSKFEKSVCDLFGFESVTD